ncbi:2-amino-4-hydroxy-6-hydroxymethyldihydropteridine diphosphokinase [Rhabdaerophilum sp. SD176]|uniref:2-amino-4-hydroxy-6- hydroxymethyldihydropteridine diphosphokinase n=1 Tax=Rhabdaerophilum sp. SD176 TaxID=2983548 RepID=UPI0024DF4D01|nr:2-amino-4-hydroxy-6-hydroxymethyldihydropteridine diphosphokinase [Rhabdaerophilum sp. SD176]
MVVTELAEDASRVMAYLALGSNLGDKVGHLRQAATAIAQLPQTRILAQSSIYRTPPWGKTDQDWFANAALSVETNLSPAALLAAVLEIERQLGRVRRERWGPRIIDIDVLAHGDAVLATDTLTLPHPAMTERAFVLVPLNEIAPDLVIRGKPVNQWLAGLDAASITPMVPLAA